MKKVGLSLLALILLTGCVAQNVDFKKANTKILNNIEKVEKRQSNKKLKIKYYSNGVIARIIPLVNGERHGTVKYYDSKGRLGREAIYVNGKREGKDIIYNIETGTIKETRIYHNNEKI